MESPASLVEVGCPLLGMGGPKVFNVLWICWRASSAFDDCDDHIEQIDQGPYKVEGVQEWLPGGLTLGFVSSFVEKVSTLTSFWLGWKPGIGSYPYAWIGSTPITTIIAPPEASYPRSSYGVCHDSSYT